MKTKVKDETEEKTEVVEETAEKPGQMQFVGTEGWGLISIKYGDSYGYDSPEKFFNAKYEIQDKFFHIMERGKEKEEGLYIPLSKIKYFRFELEGDLLPCGSTECTLERKDCNGCKLNPENIEKLKVCGRKKCDDRSFSCEYCDHNPENKEEEEEEEK
jgi:hypothetical protein